MTTIRSNTAKSLLAGTTLVAALLPLTFVMPAQASSDDRVIRTGSCTGGSNWKVKAKSDDGRIEVEGEVDSNRNGQTWRWRIRHNGTLSARGTAITRAPSGSFSVSRLMVNLAGTDKFVFRARNPRTDEVCRGVVRF